jgi:hypothetical protein
MYLSVIQGITPERKKVKYQNQARLSYYVPWHYTSIANDLLEKNLNDWAKTKCRTYADITWVKLNSLHALTNNGLTLTGRFQCNSS